MYRRGELFAVWYTTAELITSAVVTWNSLANKLWTFSLNPTRNTAAWPPQYDLSVVIPAFNEGRRIAHTLSRVADYIHARNLHAEMIVVNDGSTDATGSVAALHSERLPGRMRVISLPRNSGKGYAVKQGIFQARGALILVIDADNSTPIEEYERLRNALGSCSIAIGSRYLKDSSVCIRQPRLRILIGRIGNVLIQLLVVNGISDTQCGFKLFTADAARDIFSRQKIKRWGFDMEILAIAQLLNYRTVEVAVSWYNSALSRLRPVRDTFRTFLELVYIKLNLMSGRYHD